MGQYKLALALAVGWLMLGVIWIFTDPRTLRERLRAYFSSQSAFFFLNQILVALATFLSVKYFPWPKTRWDILAIILGLIIYLAGIFLAIWAKFMMKSKWEMPAELNIKRQNKIIKTGPFSFSRNPIYLGFILIILGAFLVLRSYTILLIPFVISYFYKVILKEEKILTKHFGKEYLEYKSKVGRFF